MGAIAAALWALAVGLTARTGVVAEIGAADYGLTHYLPFGAAWTGFVVVVVLLLGARVERMGEWVWLAVAGVALFVALYYVVGRNVQMEMGIEPRMAWTTRSDFYSEVTVPLGLGAVLGALWGLGYWWFRMLTETGRGFLRDVRTGVALYLVIGLLFWVHAVASWLIARVIVGAPVTNWVRFVDYVGPSDVFGMTLVWPLQVVVCCG